MLQFDVFVRCVSSKKIMQSSIQVITFLHLKSLPRSPRLHMIVRFQRTNDTLLSAEECVKATFAIYVSRPG